MLALFTHAIVYNPNWEYGFSVYPQ